MTPEYFPIVCKTHRLRPLQAIMSDGMSAISCPQGCSRVTASNAKDAITGWNAIQVPHKWVLPIPMARDPAWFRFVAWLSMGYAAAAIGHALIKLFN